jgi:hypothetical protein
MVNPLRLPGAGGSVLADSVYRLRLNRKAARKIGLHHDPRRNISAHLYRDLVQCAACDRLRKCGRNRQKYSATKAPKVAAYRRPDTLAIPRMYERVHNSP